MELLSRADIIFYNGLFLEGQLQDILEQMARTRKVVAVSRDIPADLLRQRPEYEGKHDPHIWFDVSLWKEAVRPVVATLSELRPDLYGEFKVRGEAYRARIDTLHHWVSDRIQSVPAERRVLVTAHDAFGYYGDAYGIKVIRLKGISSIPEHAVTDVTVVDPLYSGALVAAGSGADTYVGMVESNTRAIVEALR